MNYTLHQLKIFVTIAELESITKAAEALFLTQPAVSIQLKKLQDQFDIPLTEVIGRKLYITDFGQEVVEISKNILSQTELLSSKADQYKGLLTGKISFSIVSTAKYVLPYFLQDFIQAHPQVEIQIDVANKQSVLQSLQENKVDFGMISLLPEKLDVDALELMENHLFMIGPHQNDQTADETSPTSSNANLPLIFREKGSATRMLMEQFIDNSHGTIQKSNRLELQSNEAIKQAIIAGLGNSLMPLIGLKNELSNGSLKIIPDKNLPMITNWYLVNNKGKKLSPPCAEYLTFLKEKKDEIIRKHFSWEEKFLNETRK